jgi:hypothetical protein
MLFASSVVVVAIFSPLESSQVHFQLFCLTGGGTTLQFTTLLDYIVINYCPFNRPKMIRTPQISATEGNKFDN